MVMLIFPQALLMFPSFSLLLLHKRVKERRQGGEVLVPQGGWGISSSRRMGNVVDIVKFQVFFKQSIYCVTLNPGVTLGPLSLRQGVTEHFTKQLSQVRVLVPILGCFTHKFPYL